MTTRNASLLVSLLVSLIGLSLLSACQERTQVPATEMKQTIGRASHAMLMSGVNRHDFDRARMHVAPEAMEQFDALIGGLRDGQYDQVVISTDDIEIDYRRGRAIVHVNYLKHQPGERRETRNVGSGRHLWVWDSGVWRWHGPAPDRASNRRS